jgi:CheY-like chemotaxis protein
MKIKGVVLLVGERAINSQQLLRWLEDQGCRCRTVQSCLDACNLVSRTQFNLVLTDYELPDGTAFQLLDRLVGSSTTLFFSARVERGSLWVKMLDRGQRSIGEPVLQSDALTDALTRVLSVRASGKTAAVRS